MYEYFWEKRVSFCAVHLDWKTVLLELHVAEIILIKAGKIPFRTSTCFHVRMSDHVPTYVLLLTEDLLSSPKPSTPLRVSICTQYVTYTLITKNPSLLSKTSTHLQVSIAAYLTDSTQDFSTSVYLYPVSDRCAPAYSDPLTSC
ncbi:hypothetical protein E5288_WYG015974 [Bos mutus]|uniref:Uncharacterized protein n=1 Tax=Bos mutus TaxID=72004 RepID=A0A6B0S8D0_9CETA|nr:hypothetical protein [Bos mutus]